MDKELAKLVGQLRLLYQPVVRLADMTPTAVEVLARVLGPDQTLAGPEEVLAAMNTATASLDLTREILRRGFGEQAAFGHEPPRLSFIFNLPLDAMLHPGLIGMIEAMRNHLLLPEQIVFELTERHPVENVAELGAILDRLLRAGYIGALDDVTPSTPNLEALMELPFYAIKLDRGVVLDGGADSRRFIGRVVAGARRRNQAVVAEGIETPEVLQRMHELGATHGQGFLFARPLPIEALPGFLSDWTQREAP